MLMFALLTVPVLLMILLALERLERWTVQVRPEVEPVARTDRRTEIRPAGGGQQ